MGSKLRCSLVVALGVVLLAGCSSETEWDPRYPVGTGVPIDLRAKASAKAGESGQYWFQYRRVGTSAWTETTHRSWGVGGDVNDILIHERLRSDCAGVTNCTVASLSPATTYEYAFCGTSNGIGPVCQDADPDADPPTTYDRFSTNWNTGDVQPLAGELDQNSNERTEGGCALDSDKGDDGDAADLANGANGLRRYPFGSDPAGRNGGFLITQPGEHTVVHVYKQTNPAKPCNGEYVAETIAGSSTNTTLPRPPFETSTTPARSAGLNSPHQAVGLQNGGILITDLFISRVHYVTPPSQGRLIVTIAGTETSCPTNKRWYEPPDCHDNENPGWPPLSVPITAAEGVAPLKVNGQTGTPDGGPGDFLIATRGGVFRVTDLDYSYDSGANRVTVNGGHLKRVIGSGLHDNDFVNDAENGYDPLAHDRDFAHVSPLPNGDYVFLSGCRLKWLKNTTETIAGKQYQAGRVYPFAGEGAGPAGAGTPEGGGCTNAIGVLPQDGDGGPATVAGINGAAYFDVDWQGGVYIPNFNRRVRYIGPLDPDDGTRTIVTVAGMGYGESVTPRKALEPSALLGVHSGITLFNENGYSGVLFSDVWPHDGEAGSRGRIMLTTIEPRCCQVPPFPVVP